MMIKTAVITCNRKNDPSLWDTLAYRQELILKTGTVTAEHGSFHQTTTTLDNNHVG
jgi:hypothetical protein